ncbi:MULTISPECIES: hypothetical protein [unclassified Nocardia]|uniref:hypothetical protein n=1 Tax=unclassified Nocardia TaxID=2637762 RepID=UPI0033A71DA5
MITLEKNKSAQFIATENEEWSHSRFGGTNELRDVLSAATHDEFSDSQYARNETLVMRVVSNDLAAVAELFAAIR